MGTTLIPEQVNKNVSLFCSDSAVGIILFIPTVGRCNEWPISLTRKAEPLVKANQSWPWVHYQPDHVQKTLTWQLVTVADEKDPEIVQPKNCTVFHYIALQRLRSVYYWSMLPPPFFYIFYFPFSSSLRDPQFLRDQDGQKRGRKEEWSKSGWKRAREIEECGTVMVEGELTVHFSRAGIGIQRVNGKSRNRLWCQVEDGVKHVRGVRSVMIYQMETNDD